MRDGLLPKLDEPTRASVGRQRCPHDGSVKMPSAGPTRGSHGPGLGGQAVVPHADVGHIVGLRDGLLGCPFRTCGPWENPFRSGQRGSWSLVRWSLAVQGRRDDRAKHGLKECHPRLVGLHLLERGCRRCSDHDWTRGEHALPPCLRSRRPRRFHRIRRDASTFGSRSEGAIHPPIGEPSARSAWPCC